MLSFQQYIFKSTARTLAIIIATLGLMALLAQGLSWTELIQDSQQSLGMYLKIVGLGAPKILSLLIPIAVFAATVWSLNRIHRDAEIMVVQATGMTHWQVASPVLRLALLVAVGHLAINLWVQPASQQGMRDSLNAVRTDLATSLLRPGEFTSSDSLTLYARDRQGGDLLGIVISDTGSEDGAVDYLAQTGQFYSVDGQPALMLQDGRRYERDITGELSILEFDQYILDLTAYLDDDIETVLKASDRYLPQLLRIDETNYVDANAKEQFLAEANNRLTTPLLSIALALLAIVTVLGGDYNRQGYLVRIAKASAIAGLVITLHVAAHASAESSRSFNLVQWLIPLGVIAIIGFQHFGRGSTELKETLLTARMHLTKRLSA